MKTIKITAILLAFAIFMPLSSCLDLTELNEDPNNPEKVSSNYILTYVLVEMGKTYTGMGYYGGGISGLLQYTQCGTNSGSAVSNHYDWDRGSWSGFYTLLRNVDIIHENAQEDGNKFFEAISLTLRACLLGTVTDLFGDCPYSESLQADEEVYFPKYDEQIDIYKGVLEDLKNAEEIFSGSDIGSYAISSSADVLYAGDADQWRKFNNSLRLRYCMRLFDKRNEMSDAGINIINEFNDAAAYAFTGNNDDAILKYLGTNAEDSNSGGPLSSSKPPYNVKPSETLVDTLRSINDPRFYRWFQPVLIKWDYNVTETTEKTVVNMFGDSYTVTYMPTTRTDVDTSLYLGLPVGLEIHDALAYNTGDYTGNFDEEKSPFISFLHERFRMNTETYLRMEVMVYPEVEFLLAEAAMRGVFSVSGTAGEHYKNGILASLKRWGITDGANGFDFDTYYNSSRISYSAASNKIERIMEQKWIALWLNIEPWFDWRRTGYPDLKTGPVAEYGAALPLRYMYPEPNQDEKYMVNYNKAVERLEPTIYVPTGQSNDHTYSKIWVIQDTGKPY